MAPPAAAAVDADDDANARADADANAGADWVHRMHWHRRPVWVAVVPPVVVVAHRRSRDTTAAVNRHRSDPAALVPAQALAVVRLAPVAHSDDPVAVHRNDAVVAVAVHRHDTRLLPLPPVDSDAHGLHVPHVRPHTDDAGGAYAARLHRRQVALIDAHDMLQRPRRQLLQQRHTMVAVVHDDLAACAPYADPSQEHGTCLR